MEGVHVQEEVADLHVFVQVLGQVREVEETDVAKVRASEISLKEKVASLTAQLEGHELQVGSHSSPPSPSPPMSPLK